MMPISTSASQKSILVLCLFSNACCSHLFLPPVKKFLIIVFLLTGVVARAQTVTDSMGRKDSAAGRRDSVARVDSLVQDTVAAVVPVLKDTIRPKLQLAFRSDSFLYRPRLFFTFTNPVRYTISEKVEESKDLVFYAIIALLMLFAMIKNSFRRYLTDLFSSYFRTTVRQRQIKEQLIQSPLPSMLFNLFFVISMGVFVSLLLEYFGEASRLPFWLLVVYSTVGVAIIYGGKFLLLKFFGWVFQLTDATETYIFIVFSTNKVLGILLLPFIVLLAFTSGTMTISAITLSIVVVVALFAYRFFLSFISISRSIRINVFHFLLYLAAFEIIPLLLINKLLFTILREIS
jgi:hypothetical protein